MRVELPCDATVVSCERREDTGGGWRPNKASPSRRARACDPDAIARGGAPGFLVQFSVVIPVCLCTREHTTQITMLWTHRRLGSQAIHEKVLSCHPAPIHFVTWYTQPGRRKLTGRVNALLGNLCYELERTGERDMSLGVGRTAEGQSTMEVDARLLGRPPRFTGSEAAWSDWSFQARTYFDTVNPSMADHLDAVETNSDRVIHLSTFGDVAVENARKLFYALTMLLQGPPFSC